MLVKLTPEYFSERNCKPQLYMLVGLSDNDVWRQVQQVYVRKLNRKVLKLHQTGLGCSTLITHFG